MPMSTHRRQPDQGHWMRTLAASYEAAQSKCGEQPLILLSDIDGTILDMRHMILSVLQSFDREHQTQHFERLRSEDIPVHENHVDRLLEILNVPETSRQEILDHYLERRWSAPAITDVHQPFQGVLEVIRWFQLQPPPSRTGSCRAGRSRIRLGAAYQEHSRSAAYSRAVFLGDR